MMMITTSAASRQLQISRALINRLIAQYKIETQRVVQTHTHGVLSKNKTNFCNSKLRCKLVNVQQLKEALKNHGQAKII